MAKKNYTQVTKLCEKYESQGLQVLIFPSNSFLQEPKGNPAIKKYILTTYKGVLHRLFSKSDVNGSKTNHVYCWLRTHCDDLKDPEHPNRAGKIPWNFAKFLVNSEGKCVSYKTGGVEPFVMEADIFETLTGEKFVKTAE